MKLPSETKMSEWYLDDWNNLIETGIYRTQSGYNNAPSQTELYEYIVNVDKICMIDNSYIIRQVAMTTYNNSLDIISIFIRYCRDGNWGEWRRVYNYS